MSPVETLEALRTRAKRCTACELYKKATRTVFGEGPPAARVVLIGAQPGDREDLEGLPFVGPAGIDRGVCYVTNAVKHFKWEPRGKRRLHKTPAQREIDACRQWLIAELQALHPAVIVCLGAIAAKAVFGADFRVTRERGQMRGLAPGTICHGDHSSFRDSTHYRYRGTRAGLQLAGRRPTDRA